MDTFWQKIFDLPKSIQNKVLDFQKKFRDNPYGHNINLEKIHNFKDDSIRTARVTLDYRAVIGVINETTYGLLYIDHHDEAMRWAENKKFTFNAYTNGYQIVPLTIVVDNNNEEQTEQSLPFSQYSDNQLLKIGVPNESMTVVRSIIGYDDLEIKKNLLPSDVYEYLFYLLDDDIDIEDIIKEVEGGKGFDNNGLSANAKRHFVEIKNDEELESMLGENVEKWQIFLHPSQRALVEEDYNGAKKITGGAGTGKTVAALHRLKRLSINAKTKSILYTTYTKALTANILQRIKPLQVNESACEITNIDKLVWTLAEKYGVLTTAGNNKQFLDDGKKSQEVWKTVSNANPGDYDHCFLKDEYENVILYNNILTLNDYLRQPRLGRGKPLMNSQKKMVWKLIELYESLKEDAHFVERWELFNKVSNYLHDNQIYPYEHVIADEIQDFSNPELRFLRSLVKEGRNDLFMVGDPYQCIYNDRRINFSKVGINVRGNRSRRLRVNYRTTEEIKRSAVNIVKGERYDNFDGEEESLAGYVSLMHGSIPEYYIYNNKEEELKSILSIIEDLHQKSGFEYNEIAVASYFKDSIKPIQDVLHNSNIPFSNIESKTKNKDGVVLSTLHNLKGLEFKIIIIINVNNQTYPWKPIGWEKMTLSEQKLCLRNQKSLFYMAITRAMMRVYITGTGAKADL